MNTVIMVQSDSKTQPRKKLHIQTWGCQMNVYDSKRMADVLRPMGYEETDAPDDADMVILNTCHIREKATEKVFSALGRLKKKTDKREEETGKKPVIAVAGCVAQAEGDVITDRAPYVDLVFGPQTYHKLPQMLHEVTGELGKDRLVNTDFPVESKFDYLPEEEEKSGPVAYLSVQEGCDKFCTFCVVPYTRGSEYSRPVDAIIKEAKALIAAGAKEIQLLGQNVNAYHGIGLNGKEWGLAALIKEIAAQVPELTRLRYTTSHPRDMDDDLIQAHGDVDILMPFLHLPVQSGANPILKAMNRKHTHEEYRRIIDKLYTARPDLALSSDFIVGFPGETEQDHTDTLDLVKYVGYASAYSFAYSQRPGTPAATMADQIHPSIQNRRLQEIQSVIGEGQQAFNNRFVGKTVQVLFERKGTKQDGQIIGRSEYMQSVFVQGHERLIGQIIPVKVVAAHPYSLEGEIVQFDQGQRVA